MASTKPRKRKSLVHHAVVPRYVVKLHDDEETGEDATVLCFDEFMVIHKSEFPL